MVYTVHLFRHMRRVIGHNIHHNRVERQLSLQKLSRLTGVPEAMLDQYELGKGKILVEHMLRIASALEVSAPDLMRDGGQSRCHSRP